MLVGAVFALGLSIVAIGCSGNGSAPADLTVAAASSLSGAVDELGAAFRADTGIEVVFAVGSTGQLVQQIEAGAPIDVLLSADEDFVRGLVDTGFVEPADMAPYARGRLIMWTTAEGPTVDSPADLASTDLDRIAIANPETAPYGRAALQALEAAGVLTHVRAKLVIGESVQQALHYVESGNADVGLVAASVAEQAAGRSVEVPPDTYQPIVHALGVISGSPRREEARAFSAFVRGRDGQAILGRHGLSPVGS